MRFTLHVALALFVVLGAAQSAWSTLPPYNADAGWHSASMCDATYAAYGCDGIRSLFEDHPVPIGAVDEANGRVIMGYEIICDGLTILIGGVPTAPPEDTRDVPRGFGTLRIRYQPASQPPPK